MWFGDRQLDAGASNETDMCITGAISNIGLRSWTVCRH